MPKDDSPLAIPLDIERLVNALETRQKARGKRKQHKLVGMSAECDQQADEHYWDGYWAGLTDVASYVRYAMTQRGFEWTPRLLLKAIVALREMAEK